MSDSFNNKAPQIPIPKAKPQEEVLSANGLGISDEKYEEIIQKSFVSSGNNHLVKKVLEKMRAGEEVILAAIGGSVTEGAGPSDFHQGYAYQFKDLFIQKYAADAAKVKFVPAGIGGTPSAMGVVRYQKDLVAAAGTAAPHMGNKRVRGGPVAQDIVAVLPAQQDLEGLPAGGKGDLRHV